MSKKKAGLLIVFGAARGAAAAGVSYYLKYKSFSDELDKDFHDYEDEDSSSEETNEKADDASERTYITLDSAKAKMDTEGKEEEAPEETGETKKPSAEATVEEDTEGAGH